MTMERHKKEIKHKDVYVSFHSSLSIVELEENINDWIEDNDIKAAEIVQSKFSCLPDINGDTEYAAMFLIKRPGLAKRSNIKGTSK